MSKFLDRLAITILLLVIGAATIGLIAAIVSLLTNDPLVFGAMFLVLSAFWAFKRAIEHDLKMPWHQ